ncbi:MAG: xanthine dehydrogenase small subunit [Methylomicrobium sp.]
MTIRFLLNRRPVEDDSNEATVLLDLLRRKQRLTGTKDVCREGDCGACQVLLGKKNDDGSWRYRAVNACLLPLAAVADSHVVTVEGLSDERANPIQQALIDCGAIQCGYCTPGLVVALTGFFLGAEASDESEALDALAGNLCRCTGYAGIKRAIGRLCRRFDLAESPLERRLDDLVSWGILPGYFDAIDRDMSRIARSNPAVSVPGALPVAGGTDLFVRDPMTLQTQPLAFLANSAQAVRIDGDEMIIDALATIEQLRTSPLFLAEVPKAEQDFKLIGSSPVRARATVGGNVVNASPIADLAVLLLALNARLVLSSPQEGRRVVALKAFFQGYKQVDLNPGEWVTEIRFDRIVGRYCNYEKVSTRRHLDIASVNSAIGVQIQDRIITAVSIAAGGVSPVPLYLAETCAYLSGRVVEPAAIRYAADIARQEISPIDDVRGSADYKRLLLRQLIYAHFLTLFPETLTWEALHAR